MAETPSNYVDAEWLSKASGLSIKTIIHYVQSRKIPGVKKIDGRLFVDHAQAEEWVKARKAGNTTPAPPANGTKTKGTTTPAPTAPATTEAQPAPQPQQPAQGVLPGMQDTALLDIAWAHSTVEARKAFTRALLDLLSKNI